MLINIDQAMADIGLTAGGTFEQGTHRIVKSETMEGLNCQVISGGGVHRAIMPNFKQIKIGGFPATVRNKTFYISKG